MHPLDATLRYDHLRVSLREERASAEQLNAMQAEFVELLESAPFCDVVVVDLPNVNQLDEQLVRMLITWHRITTLAGRKFRMNGVSKLVAQVMQALGSAAVPVPHARQAGPRRQRLASV